MTQHTANATRVGLATPEIHRLAYASLQQGLHTIPIPAAAFTPRKTNGAAVTVTEGATNRVMLTTLDFDAAVNEFAQVTIPMPKSANLAAGIQVQFVWSADSGSGAVAWVARGQWQGNAYGLDAAWGGDQQVISTLTSPGTRQISGFTPIITPTATPVAGCDLILEVYRNATNASDTLAVDARLLNVRVFYAINTGNDA